jgi:iron-sulfur cluster assembly accessory protein
MMQNVLNLTDTAANRVKSLIAKSGDDSVQGLRVGVKQGGCSGMEYFVEYASEKSAMEEEVLNKGVRIFIEPAAFMFLLGSTMDYHEDRLTSGFTFENPNEKAKCGCGQSVAF